MEDETAPCRLLIWLAAAAAGWAVLLGVAAYLPEALAGVAVTGFVLWRKGRRPVPATAPVATVTPTVARSRDDVRHLVAHSV